MEKIKIEVQIDFNEYILEGLADEVISNIQEEVKRLTKLGFENIRFEKYNSYDCGYFISYGTRLENDYELENRKKELEKELEKERKKFDKQKKRYENLKAKFEKNN